jgi:D,D-heptose 1,7-bisphosphate phosphatase
MSNKAIFLDRDDTLIEDPGYISDPEQVKLIDGVASALVAFRSMGYKLIVVSNQSAVARGIITEKKLARIHSRVEELLADRGASLDRIYYCPYHPNGAISRYRKESDNRKPAPGMLLTAADEMDIELAESWMIGDSPKDVEAGFRAGCRTILVEPPSRQRQVDGFDPAPDYRAINLKEAVTIIKKYGHSDRKSKHKSTEPDEARTRMSSSEISTEESGRETERTAAETLQPQTEATGSARPETTSFDTETQAESRPEGDLRAASEPLGVQQPPSEEATQPEEKPESEAEVTPVEPEIRRISTFDAKRVAKDGESHPLETGREEERSVEDLLVAVLEELKNMQRRDLYGEFSGMRLMAGIVQVLVLFSLVLTVWFLMSPNTREGAVAVSLGFSVVLQLMALTFYTMHGRK